MAIGRAIGTHSPRSRRPQPIPTVPTHQPELQLDRAQLWFTPIDATKGWGIFQNHVYTKEEIFQLPAFKKVYALCGQVDDLVSQWRASSSISDERYKMYHENRIRIEKYLGEIRARIVERKSTAWEGIVHVFTQVVRFVMEHLPILPEMILTRIGYKHPAIALLTRRIIEVSQDDV